MVPREGDFSNTETANLEPNQPLSEADFDSFFSTLSDWNDYLENHVPYFRDTEIVHEKGSKLVPKKPQEPRL